MISHISGRLLALLAAFFVVGNCTAFSGSPWDRTVDEARRADHFAGYVPTFQSGDTLPKEGVFALALQPVADIVYFVRSDDRRTGYGGIVTFESLPAGRYAIILSDHAFVEAVQQRPFLPIVVAHRKDEDHNLSDREIAAEGGPLTLQLSGVPALSIIVAVLRLPD